MCVCAPSFLFKIFLSVTNYITQYNCQIIFMVIQFIFSLPFGRLSLICQHPDCRRVKQKLLLFLYPVNYVCRILTFVILCGVFCISFLSMTSSQQLVFSSCRFLSCLCSICQEILHMSLSLIHI